MLKVILILLILSQAVTLGVVYRQRTKGTSFPSFTGRGRGSPSVTGQGGKPYNFEHLKAMEQEIARLEAALAARDAALRDLLEWIKAIKSAVVRLGAASEDAASVAVAVLDRLDADLEKHAAVLREIRR